MISLVSNPTHNVNVASVTRSLLLDKSTEIVQMKQEINAYKQKYVQVIEEKDREVSGMFIIEMEHNMCMYMFYMYDWIYKKLSL